MIVNQSELFCNFLHISSNDFRSMPPTRAWGHRHFAQIHGIRRPQWRLAFNWFQIGQPKHNTSTITRWPDASQVEADLDSNCPVWWRQYLKICKKTLFIHNRFFAKIQDFISVVTMTKFCTKICNISRVKFIKIRIRFRHSIAPISFLSK